MGDCKASLRGTGNFELKTWMESSKTIGTRLPILGGHVLGEWAIVHSFEWLNSESSCG
jgi:hypothetical protein